jgi:Fervidolysin N-terminal prodomain
MESKEKLSLNPQATQTGSQEQQKLTPIEEKRKDYVPGEIIVKFKDGTDDQVIKHIHKELHLETIRLVYKPNLYLMKILDGSSVESVIERLQNYKEVKYSEPNYLRSIH